LAAELVRRMSGALPQDWKQGLPVFPADDKGVATRNASGKVINAIAGRIPELVGGSADLAPSTKTWIDSSPAYQPDCREGRNFNFGVREHGMGGVVNGLSYHGGMIPYGSTFMVFADYMRPPVRLSAISHLGSIWVFTHDSIGVGEDGPTHQPIEHLASLRAIPNLVVLRPCDANEVRESWIVAVENRRRPTVLVLSRQNIRVLDRTVFAPAENLRKGAYVLADLGEGKPQVILMATGSEVPLIIDAGQHLADQGIAVRLVSFPSWELFADQDQAYRDSVLLPDVEKRVAVEAGVTLGWDRWVGSKGHILGIDHYGASAPEKAIYDNFGLTIAHIEELAHDLLGK
jgi:transketolase